MPDSPPWQPARDLRNLKCCKSAEDFELTSYFRDLTATLDISNIFNPSFRIDGQLRIFAFRAIQRGERALTSFLSIENQGSRTLNIISPQAYPGLNSPRLIDPKVFRIGETCYITFNSGWREQGNDVFIMKIYPELESPKQLIYRQRQTQERNWAFFSEGKDIFVLYRINPLKILKLTANGTDNWELEDFYTGEKNNGDIPESLSIGTQLCRAEGRYYFVAHYKHSIRNKKVYLGRLCSFNFNDKSIRPGRHWLVHSLPSLLGSQPKHNTNLFSCTYFSGLQYSNGRVKLGYGVNDIDYGFSTHRPETL